MRPCAEYRDELSACAALGARPGRPLTEHLRTCVACAASFHQLEAAAGIQRRTAANVARLKGTIRVDTSFLRQTDQPEVSRWVWRFSAPALAGAIVLAVLSHRTPQQRPVGKDVVEIAPNTSEVSWHALRTEGAADAQMTHRSLTTASEPYRVKDAHLSTE